MTEKKSISDYFTKKVITILSAFAVLFSIIGGIWAFESHYASRAILNEKVEGLQTELLGTLENYTAKSDYKFYQFLYDKAQQEVWLLKRQLKMNPNDEILQNDYKELVKQRDDIKNKMENLLRKIK